MLTGMPSLSHAEQQQAAERIHLLMEQGLSSGAAIAQVAQEIREKHKGDPVTVLFDDDDDDNYNDDDDDDNDDNESHDQRDD